MKLEQLVSVIFLGLKKEFNELFKIGDVIYVKKSIKINLA